MELETAGKCEGQNAVPPVVFQQHSYYVKEEHFKSAVLIQALKIPHITLKSDFASGLPAWPRSAVLHWGLFLLLCPSEPRSW